MLESRMYLVPIQIGTFNLLTLTISPVLPFHNINRISKVSSEFLQWFAGFTDAEGNFLISIDSLGYVVFRFRIVLHVDDIEVLQKIRNTLGRSSSKKEAAEEARRRQRRKRKGKGRAERVS